MKITHTPLLKKTAGLVVAMLLMVISAFATNYYVSPTGSDGNTGLTGFPKQTIQAAINVASSGDMINVAAGSYTEVITINMALSLVGPNSGTPGSGTRVAEAVLLNCDIDIAGTGAVAVDGFNIYQTNNITDVILIGGATPATIENNKIERWGITTGNFVRAITTAAGTGVKVIEDNLFTGDGSNLFSGHKTWNNAVYVNGAGSTVSILNNYFEKSRTALSLDDFNAGITVSGNTFDNCGTFLSFGGPSPTNGQYVMGSNDFKNPVDGIINLSNVNPAFRLDMTSSKLNGAVFNTLPLSTLFLVEATMYHRGRGGNKFGLVYYVAGKQYVYGPLTTIQSAVDYGAAGDVITVKAGSYNERVTVSKSLTIQGENKVTTIVTGTGLAGLGSGFTLGSGITNVTIRDLTIQNFAGVNGNSSAGVYAPSGNNNLTVNNSIIKDNVGGSGIYANGPINNVMINGNTISGHTVAARGIVIWNALKENITITNNEVFNNNCCGIELQDGTATGVTITGNNVHDNADNGFGLIGLQGPGANLISGNTVSNNGRFGIEVKNPNGSGAGSGAGSIVINGNNVSRTIAIADARDIAGIAVYRRGVLAGNVDVPYGTVVSNNNVSGYTQPSTSEGFGIVMEGINHTVSTNIVSGSDVGIQRQAGHTPYPGDGDQSNLADNYFGRGNSPLTCGVTLTGNTFSSNGINTRDVGSGTAAGVVTNTSTAKVFCSIQSAINDALTVNGHTISASAGTYNETVIVNKSLTIQGAGNTTILAPTTGCVGDGITITANNTTVKNLKTTGYRYGVVVQASTVELDNIETISNCNAGIELGNGISFLMVKNSKINSNLTGIRAGTAAQMNNITVDNCEVKSNTQGTFISATTSLGNSFNNISIKNSDFSNNTQKGMYFEKLSNAVIENITMNNSGTDAAYGFNNGIDINLKYGSYSNITIKNSSFTGCGIYGTAASPESPAVITIKARNDAPNYNSIPATLANVSVLNNVISGPQNGIRFGESGTINSTPTNVQVNENDLGAAFANKAIINNTPVTTNATCNWYGTTNGAAIAAKMQGSVNYSPFLNNGTDNNAAIGFQPVPNSCSGCPSGVVVQNTTTLKYYCTIQQAIDDPLTVNGHTITASAGTYNEDVLINKQLTILGAGYATTTVSGPIGGSNSTMQASAAGVIIDGFTITRDGNNTTDWNNPGLNLAGVAVQGQTVYAEVRNCRMIGNRNGIDINNSNSNNIHNNIIDNNRTGIIFRNQTDNTNLQNNFITNNWTVGVLFLDASGGTNSPVQTAANSTFNNNSISGNWYGDVVDRQTGGSLPAPGANMKNFECNWYGTSSPTASTANSAEPGYAAQIPVAYGGSAVPPGGQPNILGPASANIDYVTWLTNGMDNAATMGFQPVPGSCNGINPALTITCPANKTINCGDSQDPASTGTATSADNCGTTTVSYADAITPGYCPCDYTITRTWTATDACTTVTCDQIITVQDLTPPVVSGCPSNIVLTGCNQNATWTPPTATSACGGTVTTSSTHNPGAAFPVGTTTVTYTFTDAHNISSTCSFTVSVSANVLPTISNCPGNITVTTGLNNPGCSQTATWNPPSGSSACGNVPVNGTSTHAPGASFPVGVTTVTYTFTDSKSNSSTCSFTVTVVDDTKPVASACPLNVTVSTGPGNTTCTQTATWIPPTATDNCGGSVTITSSHQPGDVFPIGSTQVLYTFADANGNSTFCYFYVTVADNTVPQITTPCPSDITVFTGPNAINCRQTATWTAPVAIDNCSTVNTTSTYAPGASFPVGVTTVTYTFRDAKNNVTNCSFNVTVIDNAMPVAKCKPYTLNLAGGTGTVTVANINNGSTDNCGIASMSVSPSTFTCADAGVQPVVLTVTDVNGNSSTCTTSVTVRYKPTCSIAVTPSNNTYTGGVPTNIYLGYGPQSARATVTASGGTGLTYSWSPSNNLSCNNCFNPLFTPTAPGTYTYTVTVTNSNGCSTTCTVTFCVKDVRVPNSNNVYICHDGVPALTMSVTTAQAATHMNSHPNDRLGQCDQTCSQNNARIVKGNSSVAGDEVKVYPNPNKGAFVVELPYIEDKAQIMVTDVQGRLIARKAVTDADGSKVRFDLGDVARGMYFVEVIYADQRFRVKLIVE